MDSQVSQRSGPQKEAQVCKQVPFLLLFRLGAADAAIRSGSLCRRSSVFAVALVLMEGKWETTLEPPNRRAPPPNRRAPNQREAEV